MNGHCCFAGCTPLACGCCAYLIGHERDCDENPGKQMRKWYLSHPPTTPRVSSPSESLDLFALNRHEGDDR
jgi:hypothetical protein